MLPYLATILVLVLISRNAAWIRANMPASLGRLSTRGLNSRTRYLRRPRCTTDDPIALRSSRSVGCTLFGAARSRAEPRRARAGTRRPPLEAPAPLKIAFAYVGPVGDAGWTFAHDKARKAVEAEFGDKVKTSSSRTCPRRPTPSA